MGSFLSRTILMVFGYAYPAYKCFKTLENPGRQDNEDRLHFWCHYWTLVSILTVCERVGDVFISWLPFYNTAKLALLLYLWHPKTNGTEYIYTNFLRSYLVKHETLIDRNLLDLREKAEVIAEVLWHKVMIYGPTRIFEVLQTLSSLAPPQPCYDREQVGTSMKNHQLTPSRLLDVASSDGGRPVLDQFNEEGSKTSGRIENSTADYPEQESAQREDGQQELLKKHARFDSCVNLFARRKGSSSRS